MYKKITSTTLKQNTRDIIQAVVSSEEPVIIYTYNEPKVILIKYDKTLFERKRLDIKKLQKLMVSVGRKVDTTSYFRKMRNAG